MTLTDTQIKQVDTWLRHKLGGDLPICPSCGYSDWELYSTIATAVLSAERTLEDDAVMPLVPLTCKHCACVLLYNAIQIGVVTPGETPAA